MFHLPVIALLATTFKQSCTLSLLKKCYPVVGCFELTPPYISVLRPVLPPQHPNLVSTYMYFHNLMTPHQGLAFQIFPKIEFDNVPFDDAKPTFMIIHGYTDNGLPLWILDMKDAILRQGDANVFVADYSQGVSDLYSQAVGNARVMGRLGAIVLNQTRLSPSKMHLIGHSLGAQVASLIAKKITTDSGGKVKRITALDPAAPLFEGQPSILHVTPSDAEKVVVLHTNAGFAGMLRPTGHIDFYANGGIKQPGCRPIKDFKINDFFGCSHQRAHELFTEAINSEDCIRGRPATPKNIISGILNTILDSKMPSFLSPANEGCNDTVCPPLGLVYDQKKYQFVRGVYNILTYAEAPYCIPVL